MPSAWIAASGRSVRWTADARCRWTGGLNRPPMERTSGTVALFHQRSNNGRGTGFPFAGSSDGRRLGWEFYFGPGNPDAGRNGCGRRRRPLRAGIHSARGACSQNGTSRRDDWRATVAIDHLQPGRKQDAGRHRSHSADDLGSLLHAVVCSGRDGVCSMQSGLQSQPELPQ